MGKVYNGTGNGAVIGLYTENGAVYKCYLKYTGKNSHKTVLYKVLNKL